MAKRLQGGGGTRDYDDWERAVSTWRDGRMLAIEEQWNCALTSCLNTVMR